jgi:hypothetical protein
MCLFSGPVPHVSGTRIYAGPRDNGSSIHQRIAYQMTAAVPDSLAMVLPIPTPPNPAEDAVTFVDLSSCPTFFDHLDTLFPTEQLASFGPAPLARGAIAPQTLVVHDVGDFEASFVPTLKDFARLDERFRMPANVWSQLPQYADWSFCVFKLKPEPSAPKGFWKKWFSSEPPMLPPPSPAPRKRHPMAFDFPRRTPTQVFFPTVHVHDGAVHPTAHFDHTLYAQLDNPAIPASWESPQSDTATLYDAAKKFVRPERPIFRKRIEGDHPNVDVTL